MKRLLFLCLSLCALMISLAASSLCQTPQSYLNDTGSPVYGVTIPVENGFIDLSNGNLHLEFPLASSQQRGTLSLNEKIVYDSRIWMFSSFGTHGSYHWWPYNVYGSSATSGGWRFVTGGELGTVSYTYTGIQTADSCYDPRQQQEEDFYDQYYNVVWTDPSGVTHPFSSGMTEIDNPCTYQSTQTIQNGSATDGSGYTMSDDGTGNPLIIDANGTEVYPQIVDRFGNYFSADSNGNLIADTGYIPVIVTQNGNVTYYDVLSANGTINNQGMRARYTVTSANVPVSTQFNQSDTYEFTSPGVITPVLSIALPDGTQYSFSYDSYGELSQLTLPTGGVIHYGYSNFLDSSSTYNRWLTSRTLGSDPAMTFTPGVVTSCSNYSTGCVENITLHKPSGDEAVYQLTLNNGAWNTGITSYTGSVSSNQKLSQTTSVNTYTNSCSDFYTCVGSNHISQSLVTTVLSPNSVAAKKQSQTTYVASNSKISSLKEWDYFTGTPSSAPTRETDYTYTGLDPYQITVKDQSGNVVQQTTYGYTYTATATSGIPQHQAGYSGPYLQTISNWLNTGGSLTTTYASDDTGEPLTSADSNGTTHYSYDSTNTFVTSTTLPTPSSGVTLISSATSDPATGIPLSQTDANGTKTVFVSYDILNRPTEIDVQDSGGNIVGKTTYGYTATQLSKNEYQNGSVSKDTETLSDEYGRTSRTAVYNGQSTASWYQQDTCYDTNGRVNFQSTPYQGNGWSTAKVCSGSGMATNYDGLDRVQAVANADGTVQYGYNGRATQVTDVNGVSKITQVDAFGRTTIVCEISANNMLTDSPASCGTDITGSGYLTTYAYDLANHKTTVQQGAQQRVFQTDSVGRKVLDNEPERGVATYSYAYNSTGLQVVRTRPQANQTNPSVTTTTTTQYDLLQRPLTTTYSDGTPQKNYTYDTVNLASLNQQNVKGRVTSAYSTLPTGTETTLYSYDPLGRIAKLLKIQPSGYTNRAYDKLLSYSYDWLGNVTSSSDGGGVTISNTYTVSSEIQTITSSLNDANHPSSLVSNVQNGPHGPISYQNGNGVTSVSSYDTLGRRISYWACANSSQPGCTGGNQLYSYNLSWSGSQVKTSGDSAQNYSANYDYDEFSRLKSLSLASGSGANYSYVYDRYGNRWQQNASGQGSAPQPQLNFDVTTNHINTAGTSYDAAGNMTSDGFDTYSYDAEGNVTATDKGDQFGYDALNEQISAKFPQYNNRTEVVFDQWGRTASLWTVNAYNGNGSQGNTQINATAYWGATAIEEYAPNVTSHFRYRDWTGSLRMETDAAGNVTVTRVGLPFGDGTTNTFGSRDGSFDGFAGYWDGDTSSTNHAPFREYSNLGGHWMSPDPYDGSYDFGNPQSFNRYGYVLGNPLGLTDPTGLDVTCTTMIIFGLTDSGSGSCSSSGSDSGWADIGDLFYNLGKDIGKLIGFGHAKLKASLTPRPQGPSNITCDTKLPNGKTVGDYVRDARTQMNAIRATGSPQLDTYNVLKTFKGFFSDGGTLDFKNSMSGQGSLELLGNAGNFAFYAIGSGFISRGILNIGAGWYGVSHAVTPGSFVHISDLTMPWGQDTSAKLQEDPGLSANGCGVTSNYVHY